VLGVAPRGLARLIEGTPVHNPHGCDAERRAGVAIGLEAGVGRKGAPGTGRLPGQDQEGRIRADIVLRDRSTAAGCR